VFSVQHEGVSSSCRCAVSWHVKEECLRKFEAKPVCLATMTMRPLCVRGTWGRVFIVQAVTISMHHGLRAARDDQARSYLAITNMRLMHAWDKRDSSAAHACCSCTLQTLTVHWLSVVNSN
jgi:hypothetical protein